MRIIIPLPPRTKKNSQAIVNSGGHWRIVQGSAYKQYEKACAQYLSSIATECAVPIDYPCNVKCVYWMPTRRKVDLQNLISCTMDVLVKYGVLADDNRNIVYANDGSRVYWDKDNPRTEITITPIEIEVVQTWKT